jgi:ribosome biogenesis GTPase
MISDYGWDAALERAFVPFSARGLVPARVTAQHRGACSIVAPAGERRAVVSGRFAHAGADRPAVGDWVAVAPVPDGPALIHAVLPRRSAFVRRAAGGGRGDHDEGGGAGQVVAANVDTALVVTSLDADFSPRRLERYLAAALAGGAEPLVVLTKADLCPDAAPFLRLVRGADAVAVSAATGAGMDRLRDRLAPGRTAALLGSSGVGKSTLVNALLGEERAATAAVRGHDGRGRHTTTRRELFRLPGGALLIDTPGMRELGLWDAGEGVAGAFAEVEDLVRGCRFSDCRHDGEPGCAVRAALDGGALDPERWRAYRKLAREAAYEARRDDPKARAAHDAVWARRAKDYRARKLHDRRRED